MTQFTCNSSQYHDLASLFLSPPESTIKELYHFPGAMNIAKLFVFMVPYIFFTCITNGLHVPGSIFIPSLLFGSALGRICGEALLLALPNVGHADPGTYALIGSLACLGGISRITISLAVIMIETTGDLQYGLPLVVTLIAAQWFGNMFNEGLYEIKIHFSGHSFIHEDIPRLSHILLAMDVMTPKPCTLPVRPKVGDIFQMLHDTTHNGFPVVAQRDGKLKGIILRKHLCTLLHLKVYGPNKASCHLDQPNVTFQTMEDFYPTFPSVNQLELGADDMECWVDLSLYLCCEPYVIQEQATLQRTFRLFRTLGLRHLCVVNPDFEVVGIITRHELTEHHVDECLDNMFNPDVSSTRRGRAGRDGGNSGGGVAVVVVAVVAVVVLVVALARGGATRLLMRRASVCLLVALDGLPLPLCDN
jgi:chloride channel 7